MNRRQQQIEFDRKHDEFLSDASCQVEINKDKYGLWQVKCFDANDYFIGGISSVVDLDVAQHHAYIYAVSITQPIR